jgi:hypothetical protein
MYKLLKSESFEVSTPITLEDDFYWPFLRQTAKLQQRSQVKPSLEAEVNELMPSSGAPAPLPPDKPLSESGNRALGGVVGKYSRAGHHEVTRDLVRADWKNSNVQGTKYHAILERLCKGLPLTQEQEVMLRKPTGEELKRFIAEIPYQKYQNETAVASTFLDIDDDSIWCLRCTGCIDLVYIAPEFSRAPNKVPVVIGDAKFTYYSKNLKDGDKPIPEMAWFGMGRPSRHDWYTIQVDWYKMLYEAMYPDHDVAETFLVYFD